MKKHVKHQRCRRISYQKSLSSILPPVVRPREAERQERQYTHQYIGDETVQRVGNGRGKRCLEVRALTMEASHGEAEDGGEDEEDKGEQGNGSDHDAEADEVEGETNGC